MVFEYINGEDLLSVIKSKGPFIIEKEAAEIMEALFMALDFCHKTGIIHRDIKPANLIVRYI